MNEITPFSEGSARLSQVCAEPFASFRMFVMCPQTWQVAAGRFRAPLRTGRFRAFLRILFPWQARLQEGSEGSQSHFGRIPAFFRDLFPFSRFFTLFFCIKGVHIFYNCPKTPETPLLKPKNQVRKGFKGEQILKKTRKTPGSFRDFQKGKEAGSFIQQQLYGILER